MASTSMEKANTNQLRMGFVHDMVPVQHTAGSWPEPAVDFNHIQNPSALHQTPSFAYQDGAVRSPLLRPNFEHWTNTGSHPPRDQSRGGVVRAPVSFDPTASYGASNAYGSSLGTQSIWSNGSRPFYESSFPAPNGRVGEGLSGPSTDRRSRYAPSMLAGRKEGGYGKQRGSENAAGDAKQAAKGGKASEKYQRSKPSPMVREYNRRISACARRRDLDGALRVLSELDRSPSISRNLFTYNAVINAVVVCREYRKAGELWNEMQSAGIKPNLVTYNTMLKGCFGGGDEDVRRAFEMLKEMNVRGIKPDRVTFNSVINVCVSAGKLREAQDVFEDMRRLGIEPDAYTFCTMAKQARHKCDVSMLDALLLHQLHYHTRSHSPYVCANRSGGVEQVSPVAYNTIADAYIRCGYPSRAISLLNRMHTCKTVVDDSSLKVENSIPACPDVQTFNVRLKALRESGASAFQAIAAVEEMKVFGLDPDHITLLTLADLCCRRGEMPVAQDVLNSATQSDVSKFLKGGFGTNTFQDDSKGPSGLERVDRIGDRRPGARKDAKTAQSRGAGRHRRNSNQPSNAKANTALFNALIRGYSALDPPNVNAALTLYNDMSKFVKAYGFTWYAPDSVTYTMLVDAFARRGDPTGAEVIVNEMESAGRSSVVAYNAYLKANRGKGYGAALRVLERMKRVGLRPDVVTYNTVIDFLTAEENGPAIAERLVQIDMPQNGVEPDLLTFNTLIKGVARNKDNKSNGVASLRAAYRWLGELESRGLKPDEFTYQSMVSACAAAGDAQRALAFFRKVESERSKRLSESKSLHPGLQNGVGVHTIHGTTVASEGAPVFQDKNAMGGENEWMLHPHPAAYVALMRAFLSSHGKAGVEHVLQLRNEMVARGLELGGAGHTTVADAFAARGDVDNVEATFLEMKSNGEDLSPVHHCIRMKALCNAGRIDDAIAILPEVENADPAVFNQLIFTCAKNRDMDRLIGVLKTMEAYHVHPDAVTNRAYIGMMKNIATALHRFDSHVSQRIAGAMSGMEAGLRQSEAETSLQGISDQVREASH